MLTSHSSVSAQVCTEFIHFSEVIMHDYKSFVSTFVGMRPRDEHSLHFLPEPQECTELVASGLGLQQFPESFLHLRNLRTLDLARNLLGA